MSDPILAIIKEKLEEHKETYEEGENRDLMDAYWQEILKTSDPHSTFFQDKGGNGPELDCLHHKHSQGTQW
jgi:hypothetical protein